jgi:hypothetical protein
MDDPVMISGLVNGPVSDFMARDLIITWVILLNLMVMSA